MMILEIENGIKGIVML